MGVGGCVWEEGVMAEVNGEGVDGGEAVEPTRAMRSRREANKVTEDEYRRMMADPVFAMKGVREQALALDVNEMTLHRYRKGIDWKEQTEEYRRRYWYYSPHVDMAVIRKAMKGDLKAAELYYERHEGWQKSKGGGVSVNIGKFDGMTNEQLLEQLNIKVVEAQKVELPKPGLAKAGDA